MVEIPVDNKWKQDLLSSLVTYLIKLFDYNFPNELT